MTVGRSSSCRPRMARELWGEPAAAVGKRVRIGRGGPWNEVIGVAGDIHDSGVDQAPPAIVYWRAGIQGALSATGPTFIPRDVTFAIRSSRTGTDAFITQIAQAIWATNPNLPLARVQTMGEIYDRSMSRASFALVMLAIAGADGADARHGRRLRRDLVRRLTPTSRDWCSSRARCGENRNPATVPRTECSCECRRVPVRCGAVTGCHSRAVGAALRRVAGRCDDAGGRGSWS